MLFQLFSVFTLLLHVVIVSAKKSSNTTSYISIRTKDENYSNINKLSSTIDIINTASMKQPVVVFEFDRFKIVNSMITDQKDGGNYQFIKKFFEQSLTNVFNDEPALERPSENAVAFFKVKDIEDSASNLLYEFPVEDYPIVWFEFQKKNYDLVEINDFIESASIFLEEYLNIDIDIIINTKDTVSLEELDDKLLDEEDDLVNENMDEEIESTHKSSDKKEKEEDEDSLSDIWTEGLLMCLIVAALLLAILVVAISWLSSLEISYTALDKETNPLKKTQ